MSGTARGWLVFAACVVLVGAVLGWTSAVVLRLERAELQARADAAYHESRHLASWRLESWLSLFLARQAGRGTGGADAAPVPDDELVLLRFASDAHGVVLEPGPARSRLVREAAAVESFRSRLEPAALAAAVVRGQTLVETASVLAGQEADTRVACGLPWPAGAGLAGRQVVAWLDTPDPQEPALAFVRRTERGAVERFEGFVLDWPALRQRLLAEIDDLLPAAELVRAAAGGPPATSPGGLTDLPVVLQTPPPVAPTAGLTAVRAALGLAWLASLGALVAVGLTLRASLDLAERRRRFVWAVTHELRTPLTTFQLYSELLADGVIRSEEQRRVYLRTLQSESRRLATLVANVLAHARLEQRNGSRRLESLDLASLVERLRPPLERQLEAAGIELDLAADGPAAAPLTVDAEGIGQILANLVDNAAKYGRNGEEAKVTVRAAAPAGSLVVTVRDRGPGVAREQAAAIFAPFERGGRDATDPIPGLGLGLALSRGLARDMGGDLTLDSAGGPGAGFRLVVPSHARPA